MIMICAVKSHDSKSCITPVTVAAAVSQCFGDTGSRLPACREEWDGKSVEV
jgi:hypothetical protein